MSDEDAPARIEQLRTRIMVEADRVRSVSSSEFPHSYSGIDDAWNLAVFKRKFKVKIQKVSEQEIEFDLVGIDASIANAFRRILLAEVPTMAIENVYVFDNSSIIADEVLAHRLGLVPLKVDPALFEMRRSQDMPTDLNTIVFKLQIACEVNQKAKANETDPNKKFVNASVYSGDLRWIPQGDQLNRLKSTGTASPVHEDILIAKLRPGQAIDLEAHAIKGIGKEHAKWSPVATASYRLLPEIVVKKEIRGELADKFAACFVPGVVEVREENGEKVAKVVSPRKDTMSREVLRHKEFQDIVELRRVRDHFIFSVESTGILPPERLFLDAVDILATKCTRLRRLLDKKMSG